MQIFKRAIHYLLLTLFALFVFEWVIEWIMSYKYNEWAQQSKPVYSWSTYSSNGVRLGDKNGLLKLILRPYITYGSMPNQRTEYFSINSNGYRGGEVSSKIPGKERIVIVGGSSAFGSGLDSDSDTFGKLLEAKSSYEIINAAVIGHQSGQELSYLVHELIDLEPDLVIAFDGWNDFMQSKWRKNLSQVGDVGFAQIEGQLEQYSSLIQGSPLRRVASSMPLIFFPSIWRGLFGGVSSLVGSNLPEVSSEIVASYVSDHIKMGNILGARGGKFLTVIQPDKRSLMVRRGEKFENEMGSITGQRYLSFSEKVSMELQKNHIKSINLNTLEIGLKGAHFFDEVHLDRIGNNLVAESIIAHLKSGN